MDRRITYRIVIDTETAPIKPMNTVDAHNMLVYDIGYAIVDKNGNVYKTRSYIVKEIFYDVNLMKSAYYANKIPQYLDDIVNGKRELKTFAEIREIFIADMNEYNVNKVYAHNMYFDLTALNGTYERLTGNRYFFPYGTTICDTLRMSRDVLKDRRTYRRYCEQNGYLTKRNAPRYTAEIIFRYINCDDNFIESHTALEDVTIEKEILAYCFRSHHKMHEKLFND